jgi:hypothetical protein
MPDVTELTKNKIYISSASVESSESNSLIKKFSAYIQDGHWHLLEPYFQTGLYDEFIQNFRVNTGISSFSSSAANIPFLFDGLNNSLIAVKDVRTGKRKLISFEISGNKVIRFLIQNSGKEELSESSILGADGFNFVKLPASDEDKPSYYVNYLEEYTKNKIVDHRQADLGIPFSQIDFEPLVFEYRKCVGPICNTGKYEYQLGKVISDKDIPDNKDRYITKTFLEITDVTAFATSMQADYLQFKSYTLTAVIVDRIKKNLMFLRDGLEPWIYGLNANDQKFEAPIAVRVLNDILFVLDAKSTGAVIYRFSINHNSTGEYSVNYLGQLNLNGTNTLSARDIGGFEGTSSNTLLLADGTGIYAFDVDKTTGNTIAGPRLYTGVVDPNDASNSYNLSGIIRRIDADASAGTGVIITNENRIFSFSTVKASASNVSSTIGLNFLTNLGSAYYPTNLAYMRTEEKWFVTDYSGRLHTLSAEGKHIGVGGKHGEGEDGGELIYPSGITPNPINDVTNPYRYRFLVANAWSYNTGFKLFAPDVYIPDFKIFESLVNHNLTFTFNLSGKWQHVEYGRGISFQSLVINGQIVNPSLWNTQIVPGSVASPGNQLTGNPNKIDISPGSLPNLKRGWNTAKINITIFREGIGDKTVSKEISFYWLPDNFIPGNSISNGNFKLNQFNEINSKKVDFIYKDIVVGDKGAFYAENSTVYFSPGCKLNLQQGSTLYGKILWITLPSIRIHRLMLPMVDLYV